MWRGRRDLARTSEAQRAVSPEQIMTSYKYLGIPVVVVYVFCMRRDEILHPQKTCHDNACGPREQTVVCFTFRTIIRLEESTLPRA